MGFLETILTSVLGGGVTGILGVIAQRIADYQNKKLDLQASREKMAHEVELLKAQGEMMAQEWASRTKIASIEETGQEDAEASKAFAASFIPESKYSGASTSPWFIALDFFRGIVRPALTLYLCGLTTLIYLQARGLLSQPMSQEEAVKIVKLVVGTILYLTTTCVLHWFGTRNKQAPPKSKL